MLIPDDQPPPTHDQLAAIIARHKLGVAPDAVTRIPAVGYVNTAFALGPSYVLRVPRDAAGVEGALRESIAVPVVRAAGIRTPPLVVFDDSNVILSVPYTVYERYAGDTFGLGNTDADVSANIYRAIGRELALLHQRVTACPDPGGYLFEWRVIEPIAIVERLATAGHISAANVRWLTRVIERLRPAIDGAGTFRRFLHNDALPTNVLVEDGSFLALIDWGECGWGDPAREFWALPSRAIPHALAGYREVCEIDGHETAHERILWYHICLALRLTEEAPVPGSVSWSRPPLSRLIELAAAAASIDSWRTLLS